MYLRLSEEVLVWPAHERGELVYRIEVPTTHKFYRIGYREYLLLSLLDGQTTLPQACSIATAKLGRDAPTTDEANAMVRWFVGNHIVRPADDRATSHHQDRSAEPSSVWARFNPFWMKVPIPQCDQWIQWLAVRLGRLVSPVTLLLAVIVVLFGLLTLLVQREEFLRMGDRLIHPDRWIWLAITFVGLKLIHELGHAIACFRVGGQVREAGLVFVLGAPLAYVDVSSCWRLDSRFARIAVSTAGMAVELLVASVAMLIWALDGGPITRSICENVVMTAGLSTVLFNANVLMRFDGYFILADVVDIPNLASEASQAMQRIASRWLLGQTSSYHNGFFGWRGLFVVLYGILSWGWKVVICITIGIAASTIFHGAGIGLAGIGVLIWLGRPAMRLVRSMRQRRIEHPVQFRRGVLRGGVAITVVLWAVFVMPIPSRLSVATVSQLSPESGVRSRVSGFVDEVFVRDGQVVESGDPLIRLRNDELGLALDEMRLDLEQARRRERTASIDQDSMKQHSLRQDAIAIEQRLLQLRSRVETLLVRSHRSGQVVSKGLSELGGTYIEEGDAILNIVGKNDIEWVALIPTESIERVRASEGSHVTVWTASRKYFESAIARIEPRASDRLDYPALAATNGGSLALKQNPDADGEDRQRLMRPHFRAWLKVPATSLTGVPAGMRLQADIGFDSASMATRLRRWVRDLWNDAS
ncbi:MAG: efflux RND transporter periplasmic adaptor subunit [Planctomycetota bacterium]